MTEWQESTLARLLEDTLGTRRADQLHQTLAIPPALLTAAGGPVPRRVLAMAMDLLLFEDLLRRVPYGGLYVQQQQREGRRIVYDHGALRTVKAPSGALPPGHLAFARLLEPLGYRVNGVYPLEGLAMTGYAYAHLDLPEALPQFFVSELHPERFREGFQATAARILASSRDPLPTWASPFCKRCRNGRNFPTTRPGGSCPIWWPASTGSTRSRH